MSTAAYPHRPAARRAVGETTTVHYLQKSGGDLTTTTKTTMASETTLQTRRLNRSRGEDRPHLMMMPPSDDEYEAEDGGDDPADFDAGARAKVGADSSFEAILAKNGTGRRRTAADQGGNDDDDDESSVLFYNHAVPRERGDDASRDAAASSSPGGGGGAAGGRRGHKRWKSGSLSLRGSGAAFLNKFVPVGNTGAAIDAADDDIAKGDPETDDDVANDDDESDNDHDPDPLLMISMDLDDDADLDALPSSLVATNSRAKVFTSRTIAAGAGAGTNGRDKQQLRPSSCRARAEGTASADADAAEHQDLRRTASFPLPEPSFARTRQDSVPESVPELAPIHGEHTQSSSLSCVSTNMSAKSLTSFGSAPGFQSILRSGKKPKRSKAQRSASPDKTPLKSNMAHGGGEKSHRTPVKRLQNGAALSNGTECNEDDDRAACRTTPGKKRHAWHHRDSYHRRHKSCDYDNSDYVPTDDFNLLVRSSSFEAASTSAAVPSATGRHRRAVSFGVNTSITLPPQCESDHRDGARRGQQQHKSQRRAPKNRSSRKADKSSRRNHTKQLQHAIPFRQSRKQMEAPDAQDHDATAGSPRSRAESLEFGVPFFGAFDDTTSDIFRTPGHRRSVSFDSPSPVVPGAGGAQPQPGRARSHRRALSYSAVAPPSSPLDDESGLQLPLLAPPSIPGQLPGVDPALLPILDSRPAKRGSDDCGRYDAATLGGGEGYPAGVSPRTADFLARDCPTIVAMCRSMDERKREVKREREAKRERQWAREAQIKVVDGGSRKGAGKRVGGRGAATAGPSTVRGKSLVGRRIPPYVPLPRNADPLTPPMMSGAFSFEEEDGESPSAVRTPTDQYADGVQSSRSTEPPSGSPSSSQMHQHYHQDTAAAAVASPPPLHKSNSLTPVEEESPAGANRSGGDETVDVLSAPPIELSSSPLSKIAAPPRLGALPSYLPSPGNVVVVAAKKQPPKPPPLGRPGDKQDYETALRTVSTSSTADSSIAASMASPYGSVGEEGSSRGLERTGAGARGDSAPTSISPMSSELNKAATLVWQGRGRSAAGELIANTTSVEVQAPQTVTGEGVGGAAAVDATCGCAIM